MEPIKRSEFELAIGQLTIAWALAEHALDRCIENIFYTKGGDQIEQTIPLNAASKIKFFRRACNDLATFEDFVDHANDLANLAHKVLSDRNWCTHGVALSATPELFAPSIELLRYKRPMMGEMESRIVTLDEIRRTRVECLGLLVSFGLFLYKPLNAFSKDHVQKVFYDAGIEFPF